MKIRICINIILTVLIGLSFISIKKSLSERQNNSFSGDWEWQGNNDSYTFNITLEQNGNNIIGSDCTIAQGGNKIDCTYEIGSLIGSIENNIAKISFSSSFTLNSEGIATLTFISPNKIEWKTVKEINGENYFPDEAILVRESSSPTPTLKEEESVPKEKPTPEPEKEPEPSFKWELKLSDSDRGYFEGGLAYGQCKKEQEKEGRDVLDRDRRMPIERMEWDYKAVPLGLGDCREKAFERIKMRTEEYQAGFEKGWSDASMPVNNKKDITKKK